MVIPFNDEESDRSGEAAHTYNLRAKEVEARQSLSSSQPGIWSKTPFKQKQKTTKELES